MATVNYLLRSKKNPANINVRLSICRNLTPMVPIGLYVNPTHWDDKNKKIKNLIQIENRDEINKKLYNLRQYIMDSFNLDYSNGEVIDKNWLELTVKKFFNRPSQEKRNSLNENHRLYFVEFSSWWIENKSSKYKVSSSKFMDQTTKNHYLLIISLASKFEKEKRKKIKLKDIDSDLMDEFSFFLNQKKYSSSTIKRMIGRFKFFCRKAESEGIEINKQYNNTVFINNDEEEDYKHPYLNIEEITTIFKKDLSFNETLDNVRDNLIIGLWTGLRISDFLTRLDIKNIENNLIKIKTKKTKSTVTIPLHPMVISVLEKRNWQLPKKISEQKFNEYIKLIGQICDIDNEIIGSVVYVDKETRVKRKKVGTYKKYELITSHICRRSFATNLFGKIPNKVICDIGGWKKEDMMLQYIKQTNIESAEILQNHFNNNYK